MSDEIAKHFESSVPSPSAPEGKSVMLMITLQPNGSIDFQLPMGNKILAYGLLETARAQLDKLYLIEEVKRQESAHGGLNGLLNKMKRG